MRKGFTLAEVLITLTIIGVIAVLTIPNLMQKWSDHADVAKVKENYSILSNAFKMLYKDEGNLTDLNLTSKTLLDKLEPYLKLYKRCTSGDNSCSPYGKTATNNYKLLNGDSCNWGCGMSGDGNQAILANGTMIRVSVSYPTGWSHTDGYTNNTHRPSMGGFMGQIRIDINGAKGPNQYGYDVFFFNVYDNGLSNKYQTIGWYTNKGACSKTEKHDHLTGVSCAYWILKHGNMDYKYRDVSAEW